MNTSASTNDGAIGYWGRVAVTAAGVLMILGGLGVFFYQAVLWLQHAVWTPFEMNLLWDRITRGNPALRPNLPWLGVQKLVVGFLEGPMSGGLIAAGTLAILACQSIIFQMAVQIIFSITCTVALVWYTVAQLLQ